MKVKLVIGLGNPGKKYARTYHNVGFLFMDFLKENSTGIKAFKTDIYMNQSGRFVKKALKALKCKPEELLIAHDDSDIELGKHKISFGRGSAGHKGVESVINELKTSVKGGSSPGANTPQEHASSGKNFWRLRIGVRVIAKQTRNPEGKQSSYGAGLTQNRREKARNFVLKKINRADQKILRGVFQKSLRTLKNNFEI